MCRYYQGVCIKRFKLKIYLFVGYTTNHMYLIQAYFWSTKLEYTFQPFFQTTLWSHWYHSITVREKCSFEVNKILIWRPISSNFFKQSSFFYFIYYLLFVLGLQWHVIFFVKFYFIVCKINLTGCYAQGWQTWGDGSTSQPWSTSFSCWVRHVHVSNII